MSHWIWMTRWRYSAWRQTCTYRYQRNSSSFSSPLWSSLWIARELVEGSLVLLGQPLLVDVGDGGADKDLAGVMAPEDMRRMVWHVASLAELPIVMRKVGWLKGVVMFLLLISVIIAIILGGGFVITLAGAGVISHWLRSHPVQGYTITIVDPGSWAQISSFTSSFTSSSAAE